MTPSSLPHFLDRGTPILALESENSGLFIAPCECWLIEITLVTILMKRQTGAQRVAVDQTGDGMKASEARRLGRFNSEFFQISAALRATAGRSKGRSGHNGSRDHQ